jgi:sigma-B regulation protein RsbU (phosphoserine phosphatase)
MRFAMLRFSRRQQSYIAVAVAIYLAMWAADRPVPIGATLFYTLSLCNLVVLMQDHLGHICTRPHLVHSWMLYLVVLVVASIVGVIAVDLIDFFIRRPLGQSWRQFLAAGWKMPFMATMIFGVSSQIYRQTRERLEARNQDLQHSLDQEAAERELHEQELQQAREIQQSLLPKEIAQVPGFEIDTAWEPARAVGGDYFDVIRLSETKLGICIADVVGKSVSAALLMANVQASVRAFAGESVSPSTLCNRVNSVLCASLAPGKFVTLFYGVLDSRRRTLQYTTAGHLGPVVLGGDSGVTKLDSGDALLGVFPVWIYNDAVVQLHSGDRVLLFTDGITEAARAGGEEFGEQRLVESALARARESTAELKHALLDDVKQYCDSQLADDATLIIVSALAPVAKDRGIPAVDLEMESL